MLDFEIGNGDGVSHYRDGDGGSTGCGGDDRKAGSEGY
jgi:hypothetical protein